MADINDLNVSAANNTARFPEGMFPSLVNNNLRELEAIIARWAKDTTDGFVTTTGSGTAYEAASNRTLSAYYDGLQLILELHTTSGASPTLDIDEVGAQSLVWNDGTAVGSGQLPSGAFVHVIYDLTNTNWVVLSLASGLSALVDDTSPQLGGQLDVNGNPLGDGTLELLKFSETGSAVNEFTIANAATGNGPELQATGDDTNIDIEIVPKGTGSVNLLDAPLKRPELVDYGETVNAIGSIGGGTQDIDLESGNVVTATVDTSETTFTFSNSPASGTAGSFTLILTDGGSQTVNWPASVDWAGGTAPSLTSSGVDVLAFFTTDGGTTWYGFSAGLDLS